MATGLIDNGKSPNSLIVKILSFMELISYKNSDAIVVLSKGVEKYIREKGGKNIYFLPNGADTEKFYFSELPKEDKNFNFKKTIFTYLSRCSRIGK